jgi:hypothetical protein
MVQNRQALTSFETELQELPKDFISMGVEPNHP